MVRILIAAALLIFSARAAEPEKAVFAMGCFWCAEEAFEGVPGVLDAVSGYAGGVEENPTYEQVSAKQTGHLEVVEVTFDPAVIGYDKLLRIFWTNVDPLQDDGQFCDRGPQYRSAIFATPAQRAAAEASKAVLETPPRFDGPIVTGILDAARFWPAEDYHQNYAETEKARYSYYRFACGRDAQLDERWGADARDGKPAKVQ
jgi:peptide-methionine (S)-S-oxide reductase